MKVRIEASARLHLGLLDLNGNLGRLYGSIGVAIARPALVLRAERLPAQPGAATLSVTGCEVARVDSYARSFLERYHVPGRLSLCLDAAIPPHVGFGSGTQLALAVGTALATLGGLALDAPAISQALGRGAHSGIGIATFAQGGLVVDGGHALAAPRHTPPLLFRHAVPETWRFVVAVPPVAAGLNGPAEQQAFQSLPPAPAGYVEQICRLLVMQLLPALIEQDVAAFGAALTRIQQLVGDSFAAVQGGRFANTVSAALIARWLALGAAGAGQSSWGPVVYAVAGDEDEAQRLAQAASAVLGGVAGSEVFVVPASNCGARIST